MWPTLSLHQSISLVKLHPEHTLGHKIGLKNISVAYAGGFWPVPTSTHRKQTLESLFALLSLTNLSQPSAGPWKASCWELGVSEELHREKAFQLSTISSDPLMFN